jgi:conjugal transfer pilin signal peptidase TrbI
MMSAAEMPVAERAPSGREPSAFRLAVLALILGGLIAYQGYGEVLRRYRFAINQTESLPNWAFIADQANRTPHRGQMVAFVPPKTPFYPDGMVFGKIVAGVPGDRIELRGREVFVAGKSVGLAKPRSRTGLAVEPIAPGVIPPNHYFVMTPHPDSLDSRYAMIGLIPRARILGVAKPVM